MLQPELAARRVDPPAAVSRTVTFTPDAFSTRTKPWIQRLSWAGPASRALD